MLGPYTRERIENWVSDFCGGDAIRTFPATVQEQAAPLLTTFLAAACELREVEPDQIEEPDVKHGLLDKVRRLKIDPAIRAQVPVLCGAFLKQLEQEGRLGGGKIMGAYAAALKSAFMEDPSKPKPITRPGSKLNRNDPCPCGSGRKYKKCCMKE